MIIDYCGQQTFSFFSIFLAYTDGQWSQWGYGYSAGYGIQTDYSYWISIERYNRT